jgi:hypothetical protein
MRSSRSLRHCDYADRLVTIPACDGGISTEIGIIRKSAFCDLCRHRHRSHFRRNLLSAHELATTTSAKRFCRDALTLQRQLFRLWYRFRADPPVRGAPLTRAQLIAKVRPIEKRLFALAERHVNAKDADVSNLARALFIHHPHFFTFVHEEGVEPTNNIAERALRTAVQWRKTMFGTRSAEGEVAVARLLTVTRTCQLQRISVLAYLTAAIHCYRRGQVVASLLPKRRTP